MEISLDGNDVSDPAQTFKCGYIEGASLIPVITKSAESLPIVVSSRISGRVQIFTSS